MGVAALASVVGRRPAFDSTDTGLVLLDNGSSMRPTTAVVVPAAAVASPVARLALRSCEVDLDLDLVVLVLRSGTGSSLATSSGSSAPVVLPAT